jgi:ABC-type antimicrobial peptide transport system permease subunit
MTLAIVGVAVGAGGALLITRWVRALLYDVTPNDPMVFALFAATLLGVAVGSCYIPARRAAKSDPLLALRAD